MSATRPPLPTERTPAHRAAISAGVKRAHARKRAIKLVRQAIPNFDVVFGDERVEAVVILFERKDLEADDAEG